MSDYRISLTDAKGVVIGMGSITIPDPALPPPPPVVAPPPVVTGWRANEPAGFTPLTDRGFNSITEDGWGLVAASGSVTNLSVVTDTTAPHSPPNVGRVRYPVGFAGGGEPCNAYRQALGRKLYFCKSFMFSSNWQGHPTLTNKIMHYHLDSNSKNKIFTLGYGSGSDPLLPAFGLQGLASSYNFNAQGGAGGTQATGWCLPNQGKPAQLTRGKYATWEAVMDLGTPGNADGSIQWWIDGVLVGSYVNIPLVVTTNSYTQLEWAPTWGGVGSNIASEQYQSIDHYYASRA